MNTRLPLNPNETRYTQSSYRGLPVIDYRGPLVERYLANTYQTIESALAQYPRIFATRFDLTFPMDMQNCPSNTISRFIEYFKESVRSYLRARGEPASKCNPRFIWAKERNISMNCHYHVLFILNKDVFHRSGRLISENVNTISRIESAWAKALGIPIEKSSGLVEFPKNGDYRVDRNSLDFYPRLADLFYRASYLAKEDTKLYEDGSRYFSCSQSLKTQGVFSLAQHIEYHMKNQTFVSSRSGPGQLQLVAKL